MYNCYVLAALNGISCLLISNLRYSYRENMCQKQLPHIYSYIRRSETHIE